MLTVAFYTLKSLLTSQAFPSPLFPAMAVLFKELYLHAKLQSSTASKATWKKAQLLPFYSEVLHNVKGLGFLFLNFQTGFHSSNKKIVSQSTHRPLMNTHWGASKGESSATLSIMLPMEKNCFQVRNKGHQNVHIHQSLNYFSCLLFLPICFRTIHFAMKSTVSEIPSSRTNNEAGFGHFFSNIQPGHSGGSPQLPTHKCFYREIKS